MVAVKNHRQGVPNPKAQMRFEITIEQVLEAPLVVEPFGLFDCTPQSDGAAAVVLVGEEARRPLHRPSRLGARGRSRPRSGDARAQARHDDVPRHGQGREARLRHGGHGAVRHRRRRGPRLLHGCRADRLRGSRVLRALRRPRADRLGSHRDRREDSREPSGGLKAKGHPPGATGIAQCFELFEQIRGTAANQVDGAPSASLTTSAGRPRSRP